MACRGNRGIPRREPRNDNTSPKEVVPEDFNEGVNAARLVVEGRLSEAPSIVELQKIAERTLESPPETKGVIRGLEFYLWYSETLDALLVFRALQVLDYLVHCGPRQFEHWAKGNIDRLQQIEANEVMQRPTQDLWTIIGSYVKDLVRVLSDPELLMVERGWSELWSSRVEATIPSNLHCRMERMRPRANESRDEGGHDQQPPPYPGPRVALSSSSKPRLGFSPRESREPIVVTQPRNNIPVYPDIEERLSVSTETQNLAQGVENHSLYFAGDGIHANRNPTIPEQLLGARVSSRNLNLL